MRALVFILKSGAIGICCSPIRILLRCLYAQENPLSAHRSYYIYFFTRFPYRWVVLASQSCLELSYPSPRMHACKQIQENPDYYTLHFLLASTRYLLMLRAKNDVIGVFFSYRNRIASFQVWFRMRYLWDLTQCLTFGRNTQRC